MFQTVRLFNLIAIALMVKSLLKRSFFIDEISTSGAEAGVL